MDSYEIDDESEDSEYDDDYSDLDYGAGTYMGEAHYGSPETAPVEIKEQMYQVRSTTVFKLPGLRTSFLTAWIYARGTLCDKKG
jgi:hypothetical protein